MKERKHLLTKTENYIKIPKDFKSLHDLKELIGNYDLVTRLTSALNNYNRQYLDSYLMNIDEVLNFIPETQWYDYTISCRGKESNVTRTYLLDLKSDYDSDKKNLKLYKSKKYPIVEIPREVLTPREIKDNEKWNVKIKDLVYFKIPLNDALNTYLEDKETKNVQFKDKIFIVNTLTKVIEVVMWATNKKDIHKRYSRVEYNLSKIDYDLDKDKNLTIKCHYSYGTSHTVGGVWINGRARGYLSGGTSIPYTICGYDIYKFCTRTNQFLGYNGFKEDEHRTWVESKSAW